ncbi:PREDICTED: histone lysine demethylase PHF8-like isoform X2 [Nicrophorus vespilloides]|uniref:Histone lysine demethylase PHF8-like isoform X2 n=1 Tax=Nicrophorus vespilloides TaxID=110193 RepID=A0ABM1N5T9_NICVS|nr:PREDICTED: histone lysine demethylase PHF8-like isoform X2 [Nicrophorus vespilloides]
MFAEIGSTASVAASKNILQSKLISTTVPGAPISMDPPFVIKPYLNSHRHNYWEDNVADKPVQTGTVTFIRELRSRHFTSDGEIVLHIRGPQLTDHYLTQKGFNNPIIIDDKDGLELTVPPEDFTLYDIENFVGSDHEMDVIDVTRQADFRMTLGEYIAYFYGMDRRRIFNVVSLEISNTGLANQVEAPMIARKLDWVNSVWPPSYSVDAPNVQKYCLMSVKNSYTDFHIDFGGTSVWYHVLRGEKVFYFVRPTQQNLALYQQWMSSTNQSETFFGDQVDQCFKCTLRQGQTMLIPTGWIHAVLTPVDSLVFGGNFLHSLNIQMQLRIYDIEVKTKTEAKFLYPFFETIHWFAAKRMLYRMTELNAQEVRCPSNLLDGLKSILAYLKHWNSGKDMIYLQFEKNSFEQIPSEINVAKFFKEISKEIRFAERYINTLNPPKPERESKRKRKKPINKDFVDYSSNAKALECMVPERLPPKKPPPIKITLPKPYTYENVVAAPVEAPLMTEYNPSWSEPNVRPEETTAIHAGGTILKIKLGTRDIIPVETAVVHDVNLSKSVYDFHDDSEREEDCLLSGGVDENEKKVKKLKVRLPVRRDNPELSSSSGIDSFLQPPALPKYLDSDVEDHGVVEGSSEDTIADILALGCSDWDEKNKRKKRSHSQLEEEDALNNVHQDEDYIYPGLDNSDDDDFNLFKPRNRSSIDEPWNPKVRVGPLLPKMNRPAREGTKKQAVEKVLEAAAKRATELSEKAKAPKKPTTPKKKAKPRAKPADKATAVTCTITSASSPPPSPPPPRCLLLNEPMPPPKPFPVPPKATKVSTPKPKKGMKTVKQRLGKILKIHKMIH